MIPGRGDKGGDDVRLAPVCVLTCIRKLLGRLKRLGHCGHWCFFPLPSTRNSPAPTPTPPPTPTPAPPPAPPPPAPPPAPEALSGGASWKYGRPQSSTVSLEIVEPSVMENDTSDGDWAGSTTGGERPCPCLRPCACPGPGGDRLWLSSNGCL